MFTGREGSSERYAIGTLPRPPPPLDNAASDAELRDACTQKNPPGIGVPDGQYLVCRVGKIVPDQRKNCTTHVQDTELVCPRQATLHQIRLDF